jgi:ABC-type bacteriocin/lantibiotic exporter with double-glycine peptidase domain
MRAVSRAEGRRDGPGRDLDAALEGPAQEWLAVREGCLGRRLWTHLLGHRSQLWQLALTVPLLLILGMAGPVSTGLILNRALADGASSLLDLVLAGLALTALFQAWLGWIRGRLLMFLVNRVDLALAWGFMEHLLRLPFPFLQSRPLGELLQACEGLGAAREVLLEPLLGVGLDASLALVQLAAMAWLLPAASAGVLATAALVTGLAMASGWGQARLQKAALACRAREQGLVREIIEGIGTLKAAGAERPSHRLWGRARDRVLALDLRLGRLRLWTETGVSLLAQALAAGLLIWGGRQVLAGSLALGTLFAFLQLSSGFMTGLARLLDAGLALVRLRPQWARTNEILATPAEPARRDPVRLRPGPLVLEDVWFRYGPGSSWVVSGFQLRVEAGARHYLGGASGSGKTTLLRLMAGLLRPDRGRISFAGVRPGGAGPAMLYLPQFIHIFAGSILENLRLLSAGAAREKLLRAARRTGFHDLVMALPMGYDTPLPHGGPTLSGGQRQLLALTAALASGRSLLLLDEPTANLDPATAATIQEALAEGPWTLITASPGAPGGRGVQPSLA